MRMGIREVENTFRDMYDMPEERLPALRGRLEHLRKKGCPAGLITGRGKVATFEWPQLLEIALALALIDVGMSPESTANIMGSHRSKLLNGFTLLAQQGVTTEYIWAGIEARKWPAEQSVYAYCSVHLLAGSPREGYLRQPTIEIVEAGDLDFFNLPLMSSAVIDLGTILLSVVASSSIVLGTNPTDLIGIFLNSMDDNVVNS